MENSSICRIISAAGSPDVQRISHISFGSVNPTMTETPSSFAEAPPRSPTRPIPDALSEMLRSVRLTGAVFLNARLRAPFGIVSPRRYEDRLPMAHLRHISVFHLVVEGDCIIE